jgi:hypothetical protein
MTYSRFLDLVPYKARLEEPWGTLFGNGVRCQNCGNRVRRLAEVYAENT